MIFKHHKEYVAVSVCPLTIKQPSVKFHVSHLHGARLSVPIVGKERPKSFGTEIVPDGRTDLVRVQSIDVAGQQSGKVGPRVYAHLRRINTARGYPMGIGYWHKLEHTEIVTMSSQGGT